MLKMPKIKLRITNLFYVCFPSYCTILYIHCTLYRNTEYVYGCAVYTGRDTKMSQNSKINANKFSTVEKTMNKERTLFITFFL